VRHCVADAARDDAGFVLIEAVAATALIAICAGAALAAAVAVTHAAARTVSAAELTVTAQNVVTDLRAATAYDSVELAGLGGRSVSFQTQEPGPTGSPRPVTISVSVTRAPAGVEIGSVTVRAADGAAITICAVLVQEAPAPGSVLPASTPAPVPTDAPDGADAADEITL
jgi:type II secretory pathway pseudopilin PulG